MGAQDKFLLLRLRQAQAGGPVCRGGRLLGGWATKSVFRERGRNGEPFIPTPCEEPADPVLLPVRDFQMTRERTEKEDGTDAVEFSGTYGAFGRRVRRSSQ